MVPAAPLLPATDPESALEAHRAEPAVVLVAAALVEVGLVVVVLLPVVAGAVVDGGDELEEQALSRAPPSPTAAAEATSTAVVLDGRLAIHDPRLFPGPGPHWTGRPRQYDLLGGAGP
jgi:hypothetical protein